MNRLQIIQRVRAITRDFTNSIFREQDIIDFINEGINRFKQIIPELGNLQELLVNTQEPVLIPYEYRHLLAVYSAARCFAQDERHYQAATLMNEFEIKLDELKTKIENGEIAIVDENGNVIQKDIPVDYVDLKPYWGIESIDLFDNKENVEEDTEDEGDEGVD